MATENEPGKDQPAQDPDPHMGEVPDKQLHRWKGEGGALPPEPEPKPEAEQGQEQ
jgi:hypothetical protein